MSEVKEHSNETTQKYVRKCERKGKEEKSWTIVRNIKVMQTSETGRRWIRWEREREKGNKWKGTKVKGTKKYKKLKAGEERKPEEFVKRQRKKKKPGSWKQKGEGKKIENGSNVVWGHMAKVQKGEPTEGRESAGGERERKRT